MEQQQLTNIQNVAQTRQKKLERMNNVEKSLREEALLKEKMDNK